MADYTLSVDITANDNASKTFQQIQENAKNFKSTVESAGEGMQNAGKKMTSVGNTLTKTVTTPIIGMGTATAKLASDFETSMAKVSTIADTSQVPIEDLQSAILDLSKETGVAASDIAESVYSAISAGQSTGDAVAFVTESTKLAKAGFTDAATSVDVLTTVMNAYGSSAGTAEEIANKLIQTQNLGKTTVNELGSSIGKVIPTANMFGVSLDNITSAYVTTTKNGIATAESTTYINSMLNELGKGGSTVSDILKEKTGKSFKELMDDGNSLTDVLGIVQQHCDETGMSIADVFSSQEAGKGAATLIQHAEDFNGAMTSMQNSAGTLQTAFDKMDNTSAENFAKALNEVKIAGIQIGQTVLPAVAPVITELSNLVSGAAEQFGKLSPEMQQMIIKGVALAAAAGPILSIGGKITTGAGKVVSSFGNIAGKIGSLGSAASGASGPVSSAGGSVGTLTKNALGLIAAGAGILLAAAGIALLAYSAIQLAQAGPGAAVAMLGLVAALALMAVGAAALAPALTAGAVGLLAFGAAILMVGAGVALACAGVALLATQLPTISEYGQSAAVGIISLGVALMAFASGATMAGAGALILGAGLLVAGAGALTAAAGVTLLAVGVVALGAGIIVVAAGVNLLAAGLVVCGAGLVVVSNNAGTATAGLAAFTLAVMAATIPMAAGAVATTAFTVTMVALGASLTVSAGGATLLAAALLAVSAEMVVISTSAKSASGDLKNMVKAIDTVDTGLDNLKKVAKNGMQELTNAFTSATPNVQASASKLATVMSNTVAKGFSKTATDINVTLTLASGYVAMQYTAMNVTVAGQMAKMVSTVKSGLAQMKSAFSSTKFRLNTAIALPHFKMSGSFNAKSGSVPKVNVSWYNKAYDEAMLFNTPTVLSGTAMGFGDGQGTEVVTGDKHLMDMMREAVNQGGGDIIIPIYIGQERIDEMVVTSNQRKNFRSGGR
nr:MAG TPA: minor tail protein [Bacteriophage sp.]